MEPIGRALFRSPELVDERGHFRLFAIRGLETDGELPRRPAKFVKPGQSLAEPGFGPGSARLVEPQRQFNRFAAHRQKSWVILRRLQPTRQGQTIEENRPGGRQTAGVGGLIESGRPKVGDPAGPQSKIVKNRTCQALGP